MSESMTLLAQQATKTRSPHGNSQPNYRVIIGGEDVSDMLESASISYQAGEDGTEGTSEAEIGLYGSLEPRINANVRILIGYGESLSEYFSGKLYEAADNHGGEASEGTCYGVFKMLTSQQFLRQVSYTGSYLERALYDIHSRASIPRGSIEVRAGRSFQIGADEEATFNLEVSLGDAVKSLCESAGFVATDLPGSRRLYMPEPRAGLTSKAKAAYNESHYPPGGFSAKRNPASTFSKVVVFRREEDGGDAFPPVTRTIDVATRHKPAPNSAYILSEFLGSYADAQNEAARLARMLSAGEYEIELSGIAANPDILLYDSLQTETTEVRDEDGSRERYRVVYNWTVRSISVEIDEGLSMSLSGTGLKVSEVKIPKPFLPPPKRGYARPEHRSPLPEYAYNSSGLYVTQASTDPPWFGIDDEGFYYVPEASEGRVTVDGEHYLIGVRRGP